MCHVLFPWMLLFIIAHLRSFEMFNQDFRRSQHSTGNWKSVISIGMSEGEHNKEGLGLV